MEITVRLKAQSLLKNIQKVSPYSIDITGDFNMAPDSPAYTEMAGDFTDVNMATVCFRQVTAVCTLWLKYGVLIIPTRKTDKDLTR